MFTVHGFINGNYIPLIFFLLPNKQVKTYKEAFLHIKRECEKNECCFNPKTVFADFEKAIHEAAYTVWPNANMKGCKFHLGQSW